MLNVCTDRYHFTVGLAACLITGRVSLLPSTHTPEVIGQLAIFAPDAFCFTDDLALRYRPAQGALPRGIAPPPRSRACGRRILGCPRDSGDAARGHRLHLGIHRHAAALQKNLGAAGPLCARRRPSLGAGGRRSHALIGSVPAQHMYGFESTVLFALVSGNAFFTERPFDPRIL